TRPPLRQVPAYTKSYVVITNDLAKIRMKPGTDGILLDYAYEGETFIFLGRKNNKWLSLQLPDGTVGYVSAGMAKVVGEEFAK
ncbi:MAG: SH3 domain-containing protein, partial [Clostridia bacterium]|nr:SH3 domain-containing protein [Clostridia bacterium]